MTIKNKLLQQLKNYITSSRLVVFIIIKSIGHKKGQLGFLTLPNNNKKGTSLTMSSLSLLFSPSSQTSP